jgi:putative cardiolipin synthase
VGKISTTTMLHRLFVVLLVGFSVGCATVDFDAAKPVSHALTDTSDTHLGQVLAKHAHRPRHESGFHLVTDSIDALAMRLLLAERAERSIDAQYYMIDNDIVGRVFFCFTAARGRPRRAREAVDRRHQYH